MSEFYDGGRNGQRDSDVENGVAIRALRKIWDTHGSNERHRV